MQSMQEGQTIKHEVYGLGIVTASDMDRTSVDFRRSWPEVVCNQHHDRGIDRRSSCNSSQDQAPPQSIDRRKSREESRRSRRGKPRLNFL